MTRDVADTYWSEHRRAIADAVKAIAPLLVDAKVASVEADKTVRLSIEGRPATPKSYPVVASALPPAPGDVVWALGTPGGYVVFGRNLAAADKSVAGVAADAQAYTDQKVFRVPADSVPGTHGPNVWSAGVVSSMRWTKGATEGYPASGLVVSHIPVFNGVAGYNQQFFHGFDGGTWTRSGDSTTGGWKDWLKLAINPHRHDTDGWKALATSWTDTFTSYTKIPATNQVFLRGRVAPPSTGWTDGTTIVTLPAGYRPATFGRSFFCPGGFVSGVGHVAVMMAVETDGRLRAWSSTGNAIPPSVDLAPISYVAEQ
ncbi:MAG: hypothetical protein M3R38_03000 [Actinomycetota bacterium]|nr:hypothetical protein [Actinomycetota bacterium]